MSEESSDGRVAAQSKTKDLTLVYAGWRCIMASGGLHCRCKKFKYRLREEQKKQPLKVQGKKKMDHLTDTAARSPLSALPVMQPAGR